jgi:ribosomal protein S18 acetylase RimI-like enzyme
MEARAARRSCGLHKIGVMTHYRIRRAEVSDAPIVAHHRVEMFKEMGELPAGAVAPVESTSRARLVEELASGEYRGWLAEAGREVVAGAGALLHKYYPSAANPNGRPTAYILNVYTEPAHRRQGLARRLILEILEWCRAHDIPRASLHASLSGRSVYAQLGFIETNEMRVDAGAARPTPTGT